MSGVFIVFEGIDGSGKTTTVNDVANVLRDRGYDVITTRQPGGTPLAEDIRNFSFGLKDRSVHHGEELLSFTDYLLMLAARNQLVENLIKPALARNQIVITDRHDWSSAAFQGHLDEYLIERVSYEPDLIVYMDRSLEAAAAARSGRDDVTTRFETEDQLHKAFHVYRELAAVTPNVHYVDADDFSTEEFKTAVAETVDMIEAMLLDKVSKDIK